MSVKITELPILDSLADNDVIAGVDVSGNVTSKIEMSTLKNYIDTNTQYTAGTNIDITNNVISAPDVYNKDEMDNQIEELQNEVDSLSTIFNAFPTESDEDESMTLDGTAEVKFKKFDLKGNTSQTTYSGKNLFDKTRLISGKRLDNTGLPSIADNTYCTTDYFIKVEPNTTYYSTSVINQAKAVCFYDNNQEFIERKMYLNTNTFTTGATTQFIKISILLSEIDTEQLEKGSSATTYEPYVGGKASPNPDYPQEVHIVRGDNKIILTGRNLLEGIEYGEINSNSGVESDSTGTIRGTNYIPYDTSSTYYVSVNSVLASVGINLRFYNKNKEYLGWSTLTGSGRNLYINKGTQVTATDLTPKYFKFRQTLSAGPITSLNDNVMITKVNDMNYEPFGNIYNVDLPVENLCDVILDSSISGDMSYKTYTFKPNTQYTISTNTWVTSSSTANIFVSAGTSFSPSSATNGVNGSRTITSDSNGKITIGYRNVNNSLDYSSGNYYIQIEKGTKANSYTPYGTIPIELCKIGNYQDYFGKSDGRNLFDKDNLTIEIGTISATGTFDYSTERLRAYYIEVDENTTYTVSTSNSDLQIVPYFYNSNKTFLSFDNGWKNFPYTFTTPSNTKYIALLFKNSNNTPSVGMIGNLQLEKGSSVSDYQPYGTGEWYYKEAIGQKILNGSESWFAEAQRYKLDNIIQGKTFSTLDENNPLAYCNGFKWGNGTSSNFVYGAFWYTANGLNLSMQKDENPNTTTLANFKTWLESNNQKVYYVLATPTITQITYQPLIDQLNLLEKAMSKDSQTNISQVNNDKPFILDVTAIKSLQNVLDRIELLES